MNLLIRAAHALRHVPLVGIAFWGAAKVWAAAQNRNRT